MTVSPAKTRWAPAVRYIAGALLCLLTLVAARLGLQWYWSVAILGGAFLIILGRRRIFRPGVTRRSDDIVCRYIPWYEGNAYYLNLVLPLTAVAMVAAGYAPGNPAWLRFGGIILLVLTPLFTSSAVRMWRRSFLRITPSALTIGVAASKDCSTEIPRERVESVVPQIVPNGMGGRWLQVEIAYHAPDSSSDATTTVQLGLQLTVPPGNLLNALVAWKDATTDDPRELLDRIERILRGHSTADV
jgi:hypothetical protein